jgi:small subunit ribosomal protein S15
MITAEKKNEIYKAFGRQEGDVGSAEVQIALCTERIKNLTSHLKTNPKDFSTSRGLIALVQRRKKLLRYMKLHNHAGYVAIIAKLGIRG